MDIEELAFKDRKILANLNAVDLLNIIEFLQNDRNQWIYQFTKTHNESVEIQKENEKLKEQLEKYETYFNRFFKLNNKTYDGKFILELLDKKETQQKEFIKYLEDEIKELQKIKETELDYDILKDVIPQLLVYEEILQKHKEIIGVMKNEF